MRSSNESIKNEIKTKNETRKGKDNKKIPKKDR